MTNQSPLPLEDEELMMGMTKQEKDRYRSRMENIIGACHPIEEFLLDPNVTDIYRNPDGKLWVKEFAKSKRLVRTMPTPQASKICHLTAAYYGKTFNALPQNAILTGSLPYYGCRIEAIAPPYVETTTFAIRKKPAVIYSLDQYVQDGRLSQEHRMFLSEMIKAQENILVVGPTGSGKTTLLNAVIKEVGRVAPSHRLILVEDTGELQCDVADNVSIVMPPEVSALGVKTALRLFPQRILFGEIRYPESAAKILEAWGSGHGGGCTSIHATSEIEALYRMRSLLNEAHVFNPGSKINQTIRCVVYIKAIEGRGPVVTSVYKVQPRMDPSNTGRFLIDKVGRSVLEIEAGDAPHLPALSFPMDEALRWIHEHHVWVEGGKPVVSVADFLAYAGSQSVDLRLVMADLQDRGLVTSA